MSTQVLENLQMNQQHMLIQDIIARNPDACITLFYNLPEITKNYTSSNRIQLIGFLLQCCDFGDIFSTRVLLRNLNCLVFKGVDELVLTSFLILLRKIMQEGGSSIAKEIMEFSDSFLEMCSDKFIQTKFFPYFSLLFDSECEDSLSIILPFTIKLAPKLSAKNLDFLIQHYIQLYNTKVIILKISIIDSFSGIVDYSENKQELFNKIIVPSVTDKDARIRTHSLLVASNYPQLISDPRPFLAMSKDSSWKVRFAFLQNIGPFITSFPEFIPCFLSFLKDNMGFIRAMSFEKANEILPEISPKDEMFIRLVESALKQQNDIIIVSALSLLPKLFESGAADPSKFVRFIQVLKSKDQSSVIDACLSCLVPYVNNLLTKNDINVIVKWINNKFKTNNWRNIGTAIEIIEKFLEYQNLHQVVLQFVDKIAGKLSDPCLHTRCLSSSAILAMSKTFGCNFINEKVFPQLKSIVDRGAPLDIKENVYHIYSELSDDIPQNKKILEEEMHKINREMIVHGS
ncbi:hypothetical protein GPJ56_005999 [Histomonas meleagridis]|uniref:uncharacterized protein n=1 Tax=Histomonas meleagridis TaxID=135588 RepID=UPI003559A9A1|nr:hypothetical protein GPJ56_005999 [Histomonas meleagridis]KAH0799406.1 hypothetical protein GO595_007807 [Histomonas meleagridis]